MVVAAVVVAGAVRACGAREERSGLGFDGGYGFVGVVLVMVAGRGGAVRLPMAVVGF